jgi:hypothetical protein
MPATPSKARRPFCNSLVLIIACSVGSVGNLIKSNQLTTSGNKKTTTKNEKLKEKKK